MDELDVPTRDEIVASLDRSLADLAAGRTHDLDDAIANLEAEADALDRSKAIAAGDGVVQASHG